MSDELVKQLSSYRAQLQQVEAALSTDQENEDLLKLQKDLQVRVISVHVCHGGSDEMQAHNYLRLVTTAPGTSKGTVVLVMLWPSHLATTI